MADERENDRSPQWPALEKKILAAHPKCEICGDQSQLGHHIQPVHIAPNQELTPANILAVCDPCHYWLCHFKGRWKSWNAAVRRHAAMMLVAFQKRPQ